MKTKTKKGGTDIIRDYKADFIWIMFNYMTVQGFTQINTQLYNCVLFLGKTLTLTRAPPRSINGYQQTVGET